MNTADSRPAMDPPSPSAVAPSGPDSLSGHEGTGTQETNAAEGQVLPQATADALPKLVPPAGTKADRSQRASNAQSGNATANDSLGGHPASGAHSIGAAEGKTSPQASEEPASNPLTPTGSKTSRSQGITAPTDRTLRLNDFPGGQGRYGAQGGLAAGEPLSSAAFAWPADAAGDLATAADALHDIEWLRIASENRLRQFTRPVGELDKDGRNRGYGWDLRSPAVKAQATLVAAMMCDSEVVEAVLGKAEGKRKGCCLEHDAERNLTRALRAHPLGPWIDAKAQKGIGPKQGARLIAAIGDPYMRPALLLPDGSWDPERPRLPSELLSYCGYGEDKARPGHVQKRQKGQRANWSGAAKMRAFLVAEKCMQTGLDKKHGCARADGEDFAVHAPGCECTAYRVLYDRERARYAGAVHDEPCPQCGPAGHPAQPGSPLSLNHKKHRALRRVAKEVLVELWREARRIHLEAPVSGQVTFDAQASRAADGDDLHEE